MTEDDFNRILKEVYDQASAAKDITVITTEAGIVRMLEITGVPREEAVARAKAICDNAVEDDLS